VIAVDGLGEGPSENRNPMSASEFAHGIDNLAIEALCAGNRVPFAAQEGEVLGQRDEFRAAFGGFAHRAPRRFEVFRQVVGRGQLHQGDAHVGNLP